MTPLVSICLPNLNTRPFLEERMETLLAQTLDDWELIVCDSHSDDGAWEFFQKFKDDPRVRLHQVPREGLYAGWNECLKRARGKYVHFATSDDTSEPAILEKLAGMLDGLPDVEVATCAFRHIDADGKPLDTDPYAPTEFLDDWTKRAHLRDGRLEFILNVCFFVSWGPMNSILFRRRLLEKTGQFRTDMAAIADSDWALRTSLCTDVAYIPDVLASWRIHDSQATSMKWTRERFKPLVGSLKDVLNECVDRVADEWKRIPNWRDVMTHPRTLAYRELFQLYRWNARATPGRFLSALGASAIEQPLWTLGRALRCFPRGEELDYDLAKAARELIERFEIPWPPKPLAEK